MTQASDAAGGSDAGDSGRRRRQSLTGDDHPVADDIAADPDPTHAASAYEGREVLRPPIFTSGRYQFSGPSATEQPPDPVVPFVAPPVSRRRRSDWPVLVVALVISSLVLAGCCIAGYVLYASKGISF